MQKSEAIDLKAVDSKQMAKVHDAIDAVRRSRGAVSVETVEAELMRRHPIPEGTDQHVREFLMMALRMVVSKALGVGQVIEFDERRPLTDAERQACLDHAAELEAYCRARVSRVVPFVKRSEAR
jgi:hypothetical protein